MSIRDKIRYGAKLSVPVLGFLLLAIQLVPVERTNPPIETDLPAPQEVASILRRACYDCHSNETVWPWYSKIAPVSWLVARDVNEGRKELNFSTWNRLSSKQQIKAVKESWEEIDDGEMPPWFYLIPHSDARLSTEELAILKAWSRQTTHPASPETQAAPK